MGLSVCDHERALEPIRKAVGPVVETMSPR